MANNYGDPNSWKPVKPKPTQAFTRPGTAAKGLAQDKVKKRFEGLTPQSRDPYYESGKALFNMGVLEPIKSMGRTVTGQNASVYANPFNSAGWKQRLGALGEDVLNVASVVPGVRAGATALRTAGPSALRSGAKQIAGMPDNVLFPELYDYGIHTSAYPNIKGTIDSTPFLNRGGAGDALPGHSYQWSMSPKTGAYNNAEMQDRAVTSATGWADRLADRTMMEDDEMLSRLTQYFTRAPANKAIPDTNLALEGYAKLENPSSAIGAPLEILGKTPYNLDREAYNEAIKNMIASRQREIAFNNKRLKYQKGLMP